MNASNMGLLPADCAVAFKEWAVVCEALGTGRQTIILRKGGIHEGREGFRVQHGEFWLYPTNFHQQPEHLAEDAAGLIAQVQSQQPSAGEFHLRDFAVVDQVIELNSEEQAHKLRGTHIWSEQTVTDRFHYRRPGLFLLVVRVHRRPEAHVVVEQPQMAGCKTWVDLPTPLSTAGLVPVLDDEAFAAAKKAVADLLG